MYLAAHLLWFLHVCSQRANITKFIGNMDLPSDDSSVDLGSDSSGNRFVVDSDSDDSDTKSQDMFRE